MLNLGYQERVLKRRELYRTLRFDSFAELGHHALLDAAQERAFYGAPMVLVAGPISTGGLGDKLLNLRRFDRQIHYLLALGELVLDQLAYEAPLIPLIQGFRAMHPPGTYVQPIIDDVFVPLIQSGYVGALRLSPDWETSEGTRIEQATARSVGLHLTTFLDDWEEHADRLGVFPEPMSFDL